MEDSKGVRVFMGLVPRWLNADDIAKEFQGHALKEFFVFREENGRSKGCAII